MNSSRIITWHMSPSIYNLDSIVIYHSGMEKCQPNHSWSGLRDHFLIHYIISGQGVFVYNDISYKLKKDQCFLIHPDMLSFYQADSKDPWVYCWIGFHGTKVLDYLNEIGLDIDNPVLSCPNSSISALIEQIVNHQAEAAQTDFYALSLMYRLLSELRKYSRTQPAYAKAKQDYVNKAIAFIACNYSRSITVKSIAQHVGIDRKYLCSLFKKELNVSPQKYLLMYRMDKACSLLLKKNLLIREAANSVGYDDPLQFSKAFKRIKGICPTAFIEKNTVFD